MLRSGATSLDMASLTDGAASFVAIDLKEGVDALGSSPTSRTGSPHGTSTASTPSSIRTRYARRPFPTWLP